jgi:hypothetical protein
MLCAPLAASAAVLTYIPSDSDFDDLDHFKAYTWRVNGLNIAGQDVTSAKLVFKQLYNWNGAANELFIHLLDTAKWSGVHSFRDETSDPSPLIDDFVNTRHHSNPDWLVAAGTADTFLTSRSFDNLSGNNPTQYPGEPNPTGWSFVHDGWSGANKLYTYTYTFSEGQEDVLQSYITNGGNLAIGLDADCHFYNSGVALTINTANVPPPVVPEPGTLVLLGSGLLYARYRRRKTA